MAPLTGYRPGDMAKRPRRKSRAEIDRFLAEWEARVALWTPQPSWFERLMSRLLGGDR